MPRDLLRLFMQERANAYRERRHGELLSRPKLTIYGTNTVPLPIADVLVSSVILSSVPVTDNSHDLLYAQPGTPVELRRSATGRLEIVGLSKRGVGNIQQSTLNIATGVLTIGATIGYSTRTATLGELATATSGGFGYTPLQALLLLNASGTILNVVG